MGTNGDRLVQTSLANDFPEFVLIRVDSGFASGASAGVSLQGKRPEGPGETKDDH